MVSVGQSAWWENCMKKGEKKVQDQNPERAFAF